jgi:hypothetical protein
MERRDFLRIVSAASVASRAALSAAASAANDAPAATVIYDDDVVTLTKVGKDPKSAKDALWVRKRDLPSINRFEVKPEGACRADICIPIPKEMLRGEYFNLTAFAKKIKQTVVTDLDARAWSFGEIQALRGSFLESRQAPDVTVPDRAGRPVTLSRFRGKKLLVVTWASW